MVCKDCTKRYPGCHAKCDAYIEEKKELDAQREFIKLKKAPTQQYDTYKLATCRKSKKRKGKK